jgi:hypothetical protein
MAGAVEVGAAGGTVPPEPHDTKLTAALPPAFRAPVPDTSIAACRVPFTSLATNARKRPALSR